MERECLSCKQPFKVYFSEIKKKFCSVLCKNAYFRPTVICAYCTKKFIAYKSEIKNGRKYCSQDCANKANRFCKTAMHGKDHGMWKGGHHQAKSGYQLTYSPKHKFTNKKNYVPDHILVVEKAGFFIQEKGQVHHINEIKSDNRVENLYLFPSFSEHCRYHMKLRFNKCERITKSNLSSPRTHL
jgi:hypothetical protein